MTPSPLQSGQVLVFTSASLSAVRETNPPRTSIQFDVGVLDHLSPEGKLRLDEVAQLFGRRGKSLEAYRRRYLTADELEKLIKAGRKGRYGRRDATLMLLMARHGLRVTEAVDLRWDQIDFLKGHLHVRRLKGGIHSVHPIQGDELRALPFSMTLPISSGLELPFHPKFQHPAIFNRFAAEC
jgi:integrase